MSESFGRGESALFLANPELAAAARRQRLAEELFGQAVKPRNVGGHAGGLAQMGQALIAGYMGYREDERIRAIADAQRAREEEEVRALMGGGMPAAAPGAQAAPAAESALATPPGSLPPPIPLGAEAPPMAQALMNPPAQPAQGGAAPVMPLPPPMPAGGPAPAGAPAMAQPGGAGQPMPSMEAIIAGMSSSSPRVRATAQMLFQQAQRREDLALRAQERAEDRAFRERELAARRVPAAPQAERDPNFTAGNSLAIATRLAPGYADGTLTPDQERQFEAAYSVITSERMQIDPQTGQAIFVRPNVPAFLDEAFNRRRVGPPAPGAVSAATAQPQTAPQAPLVQGPRASLVPAMEPPDATAMDGQGRVRVEQLMPGRPQQTPWDWRLTPGGTAQPLPGGPAARAAEREDRATAAREEQTQRQGNLVTQEVDRVLNVMNTSTLPTTGFGGWVLRNLPGTAANDINNLLDTIRAESAFGRLQQMREASPTGGALGQVTERELQLLQATIGSLEQSQSGQQFRDNLNRVYNTYLDIIHGRGNGPERRRLSFETPTNRPPLSSFQR